MNCPHCGIEATAEATYCTSCGNPLRTQDLFKKEQDYWRKNLDIHLVEIVVSALMCFVGIYVYYISISRYGGFSLYWQVVWLILAIIGGLFLIERLIAYRIKRKYPAKWDRYSGKVKFIKWIVIGLYLVSCALGFFILLFMEMGGFGS